jgi:hypothetical protein
MNSDTQFEALDEKRKYPRLNLHIPVKVQYAHGEFVEATLHDISPDGLQIRCDPSTAGIIYPSGRYILEDNQPSVTVGFSLHKQGEKEEIIVKCSICYFALLTGGECKEVAFGLHFKQFKGNCLQQIKQFFISEMEPV